MRKSKTKAKGKKRASPSKNRNRKISYPKRKPKRVSSNSKRSQKKNTRRITRKPKIKTTVRISTDTKFWANRRRRTANPRSTAAYSRKSLQSGKRSSKTTPSKFKIKKKMKQLAPLAVNEKTFNKIAKESSRYLGLKKRKTKGKLAYLKVVYKDANGNQQFASVQRQKLVNSTDVRDALRSIQFKMRSYGEITIVGYEVEEVL